MMEIERKWLVDKSKLPELSVKKVVADINVWDVIQGYLNSENDEWLIRVRSVNNFYFWLELKSKGLLSREEIRYAISNMEFQITLRECKKVVEKRRYSLYDGDIRYEIDFYKDYDFVTCEVEFDFEEEANNFEAPDWCIKDVTYDPYYKNVNLAK